VKVASGPFAEGRDPLGQICMLSARAGAAARSVSDSVVARSWFKIISPHLQACFPSQRNDERSGHCLRLVEAPPRNPRTLPLAELVQRLAATAMILNADVPRACASD